MTRPSKTFVAFVCLCAWLVAQNGCANDADSADIRPQPAVSATDASAADSSAPDDPTYPRTVQVNGTPVVIYAPQIRAWDEFEVMEGIAVVEAVPGDANEESRFGVVSFRADAVPDLETRTVRMSNFDVTSITEDGVELPEATLQTLEAALPKARVMPLDLALSYLADDVVAASTPGIISEPPRIFVSRESTVLVLLHGEPVLAPIDGSSLQFAANTNWSLFSDPGSETWYLRNDDTWLTADEYLGPWSWAGALPDALVGLPEDGNWRSTRIAAAQWKGAPAFDPPKVYVSTTPAEMILLVGEPQLVEIGGTGLAYVTNTESQLFRFDDSWYYLVSGRWFVTRELQGDWQPVGELPEEFAAIPEDHVKADVLASVPDTAEARMAALEAQVPTKTAVPLDTQLPEPVTYVGEPNFVDIEGTDLKRAANTLSNVIQVGEQYYLCYSGIWYVADDPNGPWALTADIPAAIYSIPPSSPAYNTTYVKAYDSTPTTVTYGYTSGYSNVHVYYGVPVYGTGWYYPPYYAYYGGYPFYYSYPYTYGSGSYYNPRTGTYGSVSRAYGPYGGWGYASGYNPGTGTYRRAEFAYDYDEWWAAGEAYNPRTGRYAATERHYDADEGEWKIDSEFQGPRGEAQIERRFDDDSGTTKIETGAGGKGTFKRNASDGGWNTSGDITTADGRTIKSSGRYEDGEGRSTLSGSEGGSGTIERSVGADGITREGSFSKDGKSITTETQRSGSGATTRFETSEGGKGVVAGRGADRTAVGQSSSGDIYAAGDGGVYRKTDDGWQKRSGDSWSDVDAGRADRSRAAGGSASGSSTNAWRDQATNRRSTANRELSSTTPRQTYGGNRSQAGNRTYGSNRSYGGTGSRSLNRDYQARQRGMSRSSRINRGGMRGRGGARGGGRRR